MKLVKLGSGLLFAGAAIGVSHLVQSTRAGGIYGLAAVIPVIIALIIKYPAFKAGPQYTVLTGKSLIQGYREQGKWAIWISTLVYFITMFSAVAAISLLLSAVVVASLNLEIAVTTLGLSLAPIISMISLSGGISFIKKIMKPVMGLLIIFVSIMTTMSFRKLNFNYPIASMDSLLSFSNYGFLLSLIGWMPSGIDIPLLHSLWIKDADEDFVIDFNIGYILTAIFSLCFIIMGTVAIFQTGNTLPASASGFSIALLNAFTGIIGSEYRIIINTVFILVLLSTLITITDGFPRVFNKLIDSKKHSLKMSYLLQACGSTVIILFFSSSLKAMIDLVTITAFLAAPVFAYLNHKCLEMAYNDKHYQGRNYAMFGILVMTIFSLVYILSLF